MCAEKSENETFRPTDQSDWRSQLPFFERHFGGHFSLFGHRFTVYGWNAMHFAMNIRTKRWGFICFHPTFKMFGVWWPWYLYVSPDATPQSASWGIGPGYHQMR